MIACDCRVSTRRQKTDSQQAEIIRWLTSHGVELSAVQWFEDIETGMTMRRAAFEQMPRAIFDGVVHTVVVWKLDRLSRRQHEGITLLADWCERDVRVVVVTQQIDLRGAVGRMVPSTRTAGGRDRRGQKTRCVPRTPKRHNQSPATSSQRPPSSGFDCARNRECVAGQSTDCLPLPSGNKPVRLQEGLGYFAPGDTTVGIRPTRASPAQSRVARGRCTPRRAQIRTCRRGGRQRVASVGPLLTTSLSTTPASGDLTWLASD